MAHHVAMCMGPHMPGCGKQLTPTDRATGIGAAIIHSFNKYLSTLHQTLPEIEQEVGPWGLPAP